MAEITTKKDNMTQTTGSLEVPQEELGGEVETMLKAGVHLGHAKSKNHPTMQPFIFGVRNTISVIDLAKTQEYLERALTFVENSVAGGGVILLVGTRPAAYSIIQEIATATNMPYVITRWIGGALTNLKVIRQRIQYMEKIEGEIASGEAQKYKKKERVKMEKEIEKLRNNFEGIRKMTTLPSVVFITDVGHDHTALREAIRLNIPVVALADTNSNIDGIQYPIPANDDALPAVQYMVGKIGSAIEAGQKKSLEGRQEA